MIECQHYENGDSFLLPHLYQQGTEYLPNTYLWCAETTDTRYLRKCVMGGDLSAGPRNLAAWRGTRDHGAFLRRQEERWV